VDEALLRPEVGELAGLGFALPLIGFSDDDLAALAAEPHAGVIDPDEVPEPPAVPVSEPGDVWMLGRHHLRGGRVLEAAVMTTRRKPRIIRR
jgi:hypothetical protein